MLNAKLTERMWLILAWLGGFALQAVVRGLLYGTSIPAALAMMTGVAFVLFTNYMITDPGTTPSSKWGQIAFGGGVATLYGVVTALGIAYGLFFATALACAIRGTFLWTADIVARKRTEEALALAAVTRSVAAPATAEAPACACPDGACSCPAPATAEAETLKTPVVA
jgi:hypothetical protein